MSELQVLLDQLHELMDEGVTDEDDAFELAILAGLAQRLGGRDPVLDAAAEWRAGDGRELLDAAFAELDLDELLQSIEDVLGGGAEGEQVEEALLDFDEVVAAAIWADRRDAVRAAAKQVAASIRQIPDVFAAFADEGVEMARSVAVAADLDLYDYWFAVADAASWKE